MKTHGVNAILLSLVVSSMASTSAPEPPLRFDLGFVFSHFEQQVKTEVGGVRGERLVADSALGLNLQGTWQLWGPFCLGLFTQLDGGRRSSARFAGFDASGATLTEGEVGGSFVEWWIGPLVRAQWRGLFAELGWAPVGLRHDTARDDLPSQSGRTDGLLRTRPGIAWLIGLGAFVELDPRWAIVVRATYRVRYYTSRAGDALANNIVHGTQDLTPFVGIALRLDPVGEPN